jgi:hypothetical protein
MPALVQRVSQGTNACITHELRYTAGGRAGVSPMRRCNTGCESLQEDGGFRVGDKLTLPFRDARRFPSTRS